MKFSTTLTGRVILKAVENRKLLFINMFPIQAGIKYFLKQVLEMIVED